MGKNKGPVAMHPEGSHLLCVNVRALSAKDKVSDVQPRDPRAGQGNGVKSQAKVVNPYIPARHQQGSNSLLILFC